MHHFFPLSSEEALVPQETHQPLTHNYLRELGESSCPQIVVKTQIPRKHPMVRTQIHIYSRTVLLNPTFLYIYILKITKFPSVLLKEKQRVDLLQQLVAQKEEIESFSETVPRR